MARTRVLYLNYSLGMGGIETLILELCRRLDRTTYAPAVCVFEGGGKLIQEFKALGIPVHILEKGKGIDWFLPGRIARLAKRERIDLLHTHNAAAWFYGAVAGRLAGLPVVHTEHTSPDHHAGRWMKIERLLSLATSRITAVSHSVAKGMTETQGIAATKVSVIHNGIATSAYRQGDRGALRQGLGLGPSDLVVGNVARFFPNKDHRTLLQAFGIVASRLPSARLLLAGDGPLRSAMETETKQLNGHGRIRFLGNRRDIPALLQACDLFVLSSIKEGLPIVLLEAMAAGLPVVATAVDGNPEVVVPEETGLLVPPRDPAALAEAICRVLEHRELAGRMGQRGRDRVEQAFTFEQMASAYEGTYASILDR